MLSVDIDGQTWKLGKKIGRGHDSKVYIAECEKGNKLAAKITKHEISKEIQIHSKIDHQHIAKYINHFITPGYSIIFTELCSKSLKYTPLDANYKKYMYQLALALEYLHQNKVVHGDVKPSNILLTENFDIKLIDFEFSSFEGTLTIKPQGTPNFVCPEIVERCYDMQYVKSSCKFDIWSYGCVLYVMLTDRGPFAGSSMEDTFSNILNINYKKVQDFFENNIEKTEIENILAIQNINLNVIDDFLSIIFVAEEFRPLHILDHKFFTYQKI